MDNTKSLKVFFVKLSVLSFMVFFVSPLTLAGDSKNLKQQLIDADTEMNEAYQKLRRVVPKDRREIKLKVQRKWLEIRDHLCKLNGLPRSRTEWIEAIAKDKEKTECVIRLTRNQTRSLLNQYNEYIEGPTKKTLTYSKYVLIKGKGQAVCDAYEKNLNSFKLKLPLVCGRPANPKMGISKPDWDASTPERGPGFSQFTELLWARDVNPVRYFNYKRWPEWKGSPEQYQATYKKYKYERGSIWSSPGLSPMIARFDIDNDGQQEPVYYEQFCGSVFGDLLAVLTPDGKHIDQEKTKLVMPHRPYKQLGLGELKKVKKGDYGASPFFLKLGQMPVEDAAGNVHYDVFFFNNQTYFDQWWKSHPDFKGQSDMKAGRLRVFQAQDGKTEEVCTYRFNYDYH